MKTATVLVDVVCNACSHWYKFREALSERTATAPCCPRCFSTNTVVVR